MLAGIDVNRSFDEMFEIMDSLIEEAEETDEEALRSLLEINLHVPPDIRQVLDNEARECGESVIDHLYKLYDWLLESQAEDEVEDADDTDRPHEREADTEESVLPEPVDDGDEKPQGCDHTETMSRTNARARLTSVPDDFTARLGARTK